MNEQLARERTSLNREKNKLVKNWSKPACCDGISGNRLSRSGFFFVTFWMFSFPDSCRPQLYYSLLPLNTAEDLLTNRWPKLFYVDSL